MLKWRTSLICIFQLGTIKIEKKISFARFYVTSETSYETLITLFAAVDSTKEMVVATGLRVWVAPGAVVVVRSLQDGPNVQSIAQERLGGRRLSLSWRMENVSFVLDVPVRRGDPICELVCVH